MNDDIDFNCNSLQRAFYYWLASYRWDYFITLTFAFAQDRAATEIYVGRFIKRYNKLLFGKRSKRKINCFPVIEKSPSGRWHAHIFVGGPVFGDIDRDRTVARTAWLIGKVQHAEQIPARRRRSRTSKAHLFKVPHGDPLIYDRDQKEWFKPVGPMDKGIAYVTKTDWWSNSLDSVHVDFINRHFPAI